MTEPLDPRVARTQCAVIEATRALLCEGGYSAINFDAVSKRSGVARTTIYRHWSSIAELVHAAAVTAHDDHTATFTGNACDDIRRELDRLAQHLSTSEKGRLLPILVDAASRDPEILALQRSFAAERKAALVTMAAQGVEQGELSEDLDLEVFVERLVGPIFFRLLISHQPVTKRYLDRLVETAFELPLRARANRKQ